MNLEILSWDLANSAQGLYLLSHDADTTIGLGQLLAAHLLPNDLISLDGDLGAGKTALTRGIAFGLNCQVPVSSPTFTLLMEHPAALGGLALYHFDVYRLDGEEEFCDAGLDEYFDQGGVCVIEWGSRIAELLPARTMNIRLCCGDPQQPDLRQICLDWATRPERLASLALDLQRHAKRRTSDADPGL